MLSDAVEEDEWLLLPGAMLEINDVYPKLMTSKKNQEINLDGIADKDKEEYLAKREHDLDQNLVYIIEL